MKTEFDQIEAATKTERCDCSCSKCVAMCKRAVCIGTPEDIARMIIAWYIDKLCFTLWAAGAQYGFYRKIDMVQLLYDEDKKHCVMLDQDNKFRLHESGLKPTEGKLANCNYTEYTAEQIPPPLIIALSWTLKENVLLVMAINELLDHHLEGGHIGSGDIKILSYLLSLKQL